MSTPDEPDECVELLWVLADTEPPPFEHEPASLIRWYEQHGLGG